MFLKSSIKTVLVFRALKLGDMLCFIPTLRALRNAYPNAVISLVSHSAMKSLFERFDHYIDEFITFPGFPGMPEQKVNPQEVVQFIASLQSRHFDLVLQAHGSGEISNSLVSLFNAKKIAGFYRQGGFCPYPEFFTSYPEQKSEVHRCLLLLEKLKIKNLGDQLEFPLKVMDEEQLENELMIMGVTLARNAYYCLHPGASTESKRWPSSSFAKIADYLIERGFKVVFTGSYHESELVRKIRKEMKHDAIDTASLNLPLGPLASLIKNGRGVICNDTGVSHLAAALKKKSLVIFTETDPDRWAPVDKKLHQWLLKPDIFGVISKIDQMEAA